MDEKWSRMWFEFLSKDWKDSDWLSHFLYKKDWEKVGEILSNENNLSLQNDLSTSDLRRLWEDAPFETISAVLETWPEASKKEYDKFCKNLIREKLRAEQYDFLEAIIHASPSFVTANNIEYTCDKDLPLDTFKLMLDQQPNAALEVPNIIFVLIEMNKLEPFCAVLDRCPAGTNGMHPDLHLTPLLYMFQKIELMNADWIGPVLKANPNTAMEKDFDGKTPLHLAYQHGASSDLMDMIRQAYPAAEDERDNLGRFPKDLINQSEKGVFTLANKTSIVVEDSNAEKKSYPDDAVVVCRGDMLMQDPQLGENDQDTYMHYSQQVVARHRIFETLLDEFSKIVGIDDKDVIQKAAAIQALAARRLSNKNGTIINFGTFDNPAYWYQQEVLKLVMRVYHEPQSKFTWPYPSVLDDAKFCMMHLDTSPNPSDEHLKAYNELTRWLTDGLDSSSCSLQGPVLKPLQSLFNKLFIRRGQTSVSVIGDMVRGTLLVDNQTMLGKIVKRIENMFPNIIGIQFRHPDSFNGLANFLTYVNDDLDFLPGSDNVLPYRFKANSSQKNKEKPLWFNINFFLQVPEYHRVGFSEMFVACELQIGLAQEINKHRSVHDAYERDRILVSQPLLKNYDALEKATGGGKDTKLPKKEDEDRFSRLGNCTEEDNKLIEKTLFGKISSEVLVPSATATAGNDDDDGNNKYTLFFENGPLSLSMDEIKAGLFVKPERRCINNRSLNSFVDMDAAFVVAGPYKLEKTKQYFVDTFVFKNSHIENFHSTVGLYAHVGPYLIQVACTGANDETEGDNDIIVVESGRNFSRLEQTCPVPIGATALEVILHAWCGSPGVFGYDEMKLLLDVFIIH